MRQATRHLAGYCGWPARRAPSTILGMRIAVLCDIHGNLPALQAVLAEVEEAGVDLVVPGARGLIDHP